ncbi:MAG: sigma-70 family RNA polymerase sigma factor [Mycobacteriales bacterium]
MIDSATEYDALEDAALVALVDEGDAGALDALYRRYSAASYALARRVLSDEAAARDLVRGVFIEAWRQAGHVAATTGGFATSLLSVTHQRAVEAVRRDERLRRRRSAAEALQFAEPTTEAGRPASADAVRRDRVRAALASLPAPEQAAVALAYFGGYTQREIAAMTGTPLENVKAQILAGLHALRDSLDPALTPAEGRAST